ncbi:502_t:CDS:2, partial [Gigaspora rosea]
SPLTSFRNAVIFLVSVIKNQYSGMSLKSPLSVIGKSRANCSGCSSGYSSNIIS